MPAERLCGAKKHDDSGDTCKNPAGAGTDHLGWGKCKWHGGNAKMLKVAAAREEAAELVKTLRAGQPLDIDPDQALLQEVHRTAGVVQWLEDLIGELGVKDLTVMTEIGYRPRAFHEMWIKEREHLAKVAKMTLDAGVQERHVRIAEEQGALLATVIRNVLGDLSLTPEQRAQAPEIVHRHLLAISAGAG